MSHKTKEISEQISSLFKQGNLTKVWILIQTNILKKVFSFNLKDMSLGIHEEQLPEQVSDGPFWLSMTFQLSWFFANDVKPLDACTYLT